jgi:hypothetical protein
MDKGIHLTKQVATMTAEACRELFSAYGVALEPTPREFEAGTERMLCGVIGFVGSGVRGSCVLAGHDSPIMASCPEGGSIRDWIGELTNQLAGRLKSRFLKHDVEIGLSTPVALSGVSLLPLPRSPLKPSWFSAHEGAVLVWVEVDADAQFGLSKVEASESTHSEGDILLF